MMDNLLVIDACVRQRDSRTLRIAEPIIEALKPRFKHFIRYNLPEMDCIGPLTPKAFADRGDGNIPEWAKEAATRIRQASAIVIAAPFWDMSFPAVLKCFFEQVSLFDITFTDNGETCVGLCQKAPVIYITTRGMDIPTGSPREQATPSLKALASLWGLGEITTIAASNMDYSPESVIDAKITDAVKEGISAVNELFPPKH